MKRNQAFLQQNHLERRYSTETCPVEEREGEREKILMEESPLTVQ